MKIFKSGICSIMGLISLSTMASAADLNSAREVAYSQGGSCQFPVVSRLSGDAAVYMRKAANRKSKPVATLADQASVEAIFVETGEYIYDAALKEGSDLWVMVDFESTVAYVHALYLVCPSEIPSINISVPEVPEVPEVPADIMTINGGNRQAGLSTIIPAAAPELDGAVFENCQTVRLQSSNHARTLAIHDFAKLDSATTGELNNDSLAKLVYVDQGQDLYSPASGYHSSAWILVSADDSIGYISTLEARCETTKK